METRNYFLMLLKYKLVISLILLAFLGTTVAHATFAQVRSQATASPNPSDVFSVYGPAIRTINPSATPSYAPIQVPGGAEWKPDTEVTIVGKSAKRSLYFIDWVLLHGYIPNDGYKPISEVWKRVQFAVIGLSTLIVIAVGFLLMIRRDKDISLMKFLPLFIGLMAYVLLSFSIVKVIYQFNEGLSRSFMRVEKANGQKGFITSEDLLAVAFNYEDYEGSRRFGSAYDESALISLLLARLTTWTYMAMGGMLIVRQIILWFFMIISPFLALLIPFPLLRNTAKIWIGEFFRWLFYGLLFSMFLRGLVIMWRLGIPMDFAADPAPAGPGGLGVMFPTSVRFLLAGPNYLAVPEKAATTNINTIDTYANYIVALIMLWVVIILPWILLRIFRDMLMNFFKSDKGDNFLMQLGNLYTRFSPGGGGTRDVRTPVTPPPQPKSPSPTGAGQALELPFRKVNIVARDVAVKKDIQNNNVVNMDREVTQAATTELARMAGMQMPKMADIAKMEMNKNQMSAQWNNLSRIGNPNLASNPQEVQKFASLRSELERRANSGDERAKTMLQAAQSAAAVAPSVAVGLNAAVGTKAQAATVQLGAQRAAAVIAQASSNINPNIVVAGGMMAASANAQKVIAQAKVAGKVQGGRIMPVVNRVQSVSLEDYEEVKKMWLDHYKNNDIPAGVNVKNKAEWIKQDIEKAESAIAMLGNINPEVKQKGLEMVAGLLPFLLLGGFSEQETITYLKAKTEAAKQVLAELEAGKKTAEQDEEESLEVTNKQGAAQASKTMMAEVDEETGAPKLPTDMPTTQLPSQTPEQPQQASQPSPAGTSDATMAYLKGKIEGADEVKSELEQEKELKEKQEKEAEDTLEVGNKKADKDQEHMASELEDKPEDSKADSPVEGIPLEDPLKAAALEDAATEAAAKAAGGLTATDLDTSKS